MTSASDASAAFVCAAAAASARHPMIGLGRSRRLPRRTSRDSSRTAARAHRHRPRVRAWRLRALRPARCVRAAASIARRCELALGCRFQVARTPDDARLSRDVSAIVSLRPPDRAGGADSGSPRAGHGRVVGLRLGLAGRARVSCSAVTGRHENSVYGHASRWKDFASVRGC